jgi:cytidylate kinase
MIILIGLTACGKTTLAKFLCTVLECEHLSGGKIQRAVALKYGITEERFDKEWSAFIELHPELDRECDEYQLKRWWSAFEGHRPIVVDSRIAHLLLPDFPCSAKFWLECDILKRTERRFRDKTVKKCAYAPKNLTQAAVEIRERDLRDANRWTKLYQMGNTQTYPFAGTIDTGNLSVEQAADQILRIVKRNQVA